MNDIAPLARDAAPAGTPTAPTKPRRRVSYEALEQLVPEARRYDVSIQSGLVFSVHPNGFKTWVFVYDQNARLRRRTLGVFPDMTPKQARRALRDAQKRLHAFDDAPRASLPSPSGSMLLHDVVDTLDELANMRNALILAGALLVTATGWIWISAPAEQPRQLTAQAAAPVANGAAADGDAVTSERPALEVPAQALLPTSQATVSVPASKPATLANASPVVRLEAELDEPVPQAMAQAVASDLLSAVESEPEPEQAPEPAELPSVATAPPSAPLRQPEPVAAAPTPSTTPEPPTDALPTATSDAPTEAPITLALAEAAVEPTWMAGSQVYSEQVTRAVLTRAVVNREPTETLPTYLQAEGEQPVKVYYFTEFGDMAGEQVHYRWTHRGRVVAEVPVNIGNAWRWRSYSQKDIRPDETGEWLVSVVDSEGQIMAQAGFAILDVEAP